MNSILIYTFLSCILILAVNISIEEEYSLKFFVRLVAFVLLVITSLMLMNGIAKVQYKNGQVDAMHGKYEYEMKINTHTDTTYVRKEK